MSAVAPEHKVECAFLLIEEITFFVLVFFYRKKEDIALTLLLYKTPCLLFERGPPAGKIKRGRFPACVLRRIGYNMGCSLINRASTHSRDGAKIVNGLHGRRQGPLGHNEALSRYTST